MNGQFDRPAALRAALLVTFATYINYAVGLIVSIVVARELGPREYGQYAYIVWLAGTLTTLYCNGLTFSAIRFVSDRIGSRDLQGARNVHALLRRWFRSGLLIITCLYALTSYWLLPPGWEYSAWLCVVAVIIAGGTKADYLLGSSTSKGYGRFEIEATTMNILSVINLIGVFVLLAVDASLPAFLILFVGLSAGHALIGRILMRRAGIVSGSGSLDPELKGRILNHYLWGSGLFVVYAFSNKSIENFLLALYVGPEAVGWFAIAAAMTRGGIDLLVSGLSTVLMPVMSHAFGSKDHERAYRIFSDAVRYYYFLGVLLAGVGLLWSEPAITILYGAQYAPAVIGLQVMMVVGALTLVDSATLSILTTTDNQAARVGAAAFLLVSTLVLSVVLIPAYGFLGALAAHAIARIAYFFVSLGVASRLLHFTLPYGALLRSTAASAVGAACAAIVLLGSTSLMAQIVAGVCYVLGCLLASVWLRVWSREDIHFLTPLADRFWLARRLQSWLIGQARKS